MQNTGLSGAIPLADALIQKHNRDQPVIVHIALISPVAVLLIRWAWSGNPSSKLSNPVRLSSAPRHTRFPDKSEVMKQSLCNFEQTGLTQ
jgi:hypothetical protein